MEKDSKVNTFDKVQTNLLARELGGGIGPVKMKVVSPKLNEALQHFPPRLFT